MSWVWSIVTELETQEETLFSLALLEAYLDSNDDGHPGSIGDELRQLLHEFLTNNIMRDLDCLVSNNFVSHFTLQKTASSWAEIEHSSLKHHPDGVGPQQNIAEARSHISSIIWH